MSFNLFNIFRPRSPEEASKAGVKVEAPGWADYVSQTIGGIGYAAKNALRAVVTAPTHLAMGTLALGRRSVEGTLSVLTNPVFRLIDGYHTRIDKLLAFGGK
ncbi:MAG TPA: hypothetical protein DEB30_05070 [Candidatus Peribacter riflensis]|uniref:Uncharacterized protein n=1 Tax=Candidatus Peribacter riflensis TaxID=1735162 RepID=A0A0S1SDU4_9BACT|nr:MAG: hypothetical protein PeribacterA2_0244 [Candidatus Peribacter riflensis]OGJ77281.1 MAG: hypothetical protein A2398_03840 [Candidatus Peribacteria bacterium RIFOXYB1_FULL_57_12]OGJ83067.1 MAG: hypothetical protein A2412_01030 [Candidatus Peribacteria bacterium RIFOXYC1_FULL_58_8]ALM10738.1 MAG: hypothetical protein PeribacterB2_0244 [Candidatus Peribacter riflensis]ALM11840.1 MAG: hypothetical protein PeribacterC2_0243 [Candidatus Peribacter riflensis]